MKFSVLGSGSWGTAFANYLAHEGYEVVLWGRNASVIEEIKTNHTNHRYLKEALLDTSLQVSTDLEKALEGDSIVILALSAQNMRSFLTEHFELLKKKEYFVNLAKGIEIGTLQLMHEVFFEIFPEKTYAALSGPSHAEEVAAFQATMLVCAGRDEAFNKRIQSISSESLRIYTSSDLVGVESGGALKNIIAIAVGILDGLHEGDNAKAAIMTRGMHEITQLGLKLGAKLETYLGLSGMGDLIVTCDSKHSRNRQFGVLLASGKKQSEATKEVDMVVEGLYTLKSALDLSKHYGIELPISSLLYEVIYCDMPLEQARKELMTRTYKEEFVL
ncbi:NAD(P)H-dependent glycerol-3-phosphate dehydrogenase [Guggenheimella bovis]